MSDAIIVALIGGAVTIISIIDRRGHKEINKQFAEIRITLNGRLEQMLASEREAGRREGKAS